MNRVAFVTLQRQHPRVRQCVVELIELAQAGDGRSVPEARFLVAVRQGDLKAGVLLEASESTLTAAPCARAEAERRAIDFIQRRMAQGDALVQQHGFAGLVMPTAPLPTAPVPSAPVETAPAAPPVSPAIGALVARFAPDRWKLEPAARCSRIVWSVAEHSAPGQPGQDALVALVPRLVSLLESGDDMLDYCLAVAMARLGDSGAAPALQHLSTRGRSPATRRIAQQASLLLQTPSALAAHVARVLPDWQAVWHSTLRGAELASAVQAQQASSGTPWPQLLSAWYDAALAQPATRAALVSLLRALPLVPGPFQGLRYVYKTAELRRDAEVLGALHARFETTRAYFENRWLMRRGFIDPATGKWVKTSPTAELARPDARLAYSSRTRNYLRLRAWRQLRRLAALQHPYAPELAVQLLLGLCDDELPPAREDRRSVYINGHYREMHRHLHPSHGWRLAQRLLLATHPDVKVTPRGKHWWSTRPLDTHCAMPERTDGLREMWDAHPEALLALACQSRAAVVHAVVARALQDHADWVAQQPVALLETLLQSPYAPTARVGLVAVRSRLAGCTTVPEQLPWLRLLVCSSDAEARDVALALMASQPAAFAQHVDLVVRLLTSPHERVRLQGLGLASLAAAAPLAAELLAALLAWDDSSEGLDDVAAWLSQQLSGPLAPMAAQAGVEPLLCLLDHPATPLLQLAVSWVLAHPHAAALLPAPLLLRLLASSDDERRACGVRLLGVLSDELLRSQVGLLGELALHPHAGLRAAVAPALQRLAAHDAPFAQTLAQRLHQALFVSEPAEGVHDNALHLLTTLLAAHAPARDASGVWRALQASSAGAQRYGAWALPALSADQFSLRQWATLANHRDQRVRRQAHEVIATALGPCPTPEQAAALLPLADALFDDARAFAQQLMSERLLDEALPPELLIAWIDHPAPWAQALGRARLVRRMSAGEASVCLSSLSQHPSTAVQLFVTQWLLDLPPGSPEQLATQLQVLKPYFLTVLSQVHKGRTAKTRITAFLRSHTQHPETAAVVAEIFARQVVTVSLTDKPQYIAGLRDIAARHPHIALPFLAVQPVAAAELLDRLRRKP